MHKIVTVIGARPQFIKAAPVAKAFSNYDGMKEIIVHTGQHYDAGMSAVFFSELDIPAPKYNLEVGSGSHAFQTAAIMTRLEEILNIEKPAMILIYGDTNSTIAAALTAAKQHIPICHVEAGLRSFNRRMPEEINRIVADVLSSILFAPTQKAILNLANEGITKNVFASGDVMYDTALQSAEMAKKKSAIMEKLGIKPKEYLLATIHRAENTDNQDRLRNIFTAFSQIGKNLRVVLPLHPRTRKLLSEYNLDSIAKGILIIEPVGFLDMVNLETNARLIATDSGGVQKEAYFHRVPCVTLRDQTEWVETVEAGWNILADVSSVDAITSKVELMISGKQDRKEILEYGDGKAAQEIVSTIKSYLN
jgi:UDP-GlcNAc3NAcA epimerase